MSLIYTLLKTKDTFNLSVSQDSTYKVVYTSVEANETVIDTKDILSGETIALSLVKDGKYTIYLNATGEFEVTENFFVNKLLQNSFIESVKNLLCECTDEKDPCSSFTNQLNSQDQKLLNDKNIYTKIFTYLNYYLPQYGQDYIDGFLEYIENAVLVEENSIQSDINTIVGQEIIQGSSKYNRNIFSFYLLIYWAGYYFTEKLFIGDAMDDEELAFLKEKFKVTEITSCAKDLKINFGNLETTFNKYIKQLEIFSFQLDLIGQGLNNLLEIASFPDSYTETELLAGVEITYSKIAKTGFVVKGGAKNPYKILDVLGNDITAIFEYHYIDEVSYYLTQDIITHSTIYFKFVKNN